MLPSKVCLIFTFAVRNSGSNAFVIVGESIPIRVFLAGYDLTPTMRDINKKFSVRYFLNLVLMDTEDRRYFKQQVIIDKLTSEKQMFEMFNVVGNNSVAQS